MQVILLKDIPGVGQKGSVKSVSDGYAMNFLIPHKQAEMATSQKIEELEKKRAEAEAIKVSQLSAWKEQAARLLNASVTVRTDANQKGQLYQQLSHKAILERIGKELGVHIAEDALRDIKPIKSLGRADIELELGGKLVPFTVFVERES
ncbi:50S ribosomal protein L9 [Candidatus Kaiserbacteria bacterium]|nr:50S ribosomal protein L9 [Candidatus Kaiserbacteria bacterium]